MKTKTISLGIISIILLVSLASPVLALTVESVDSNPQEVKPGERVRVILNIENNLNADAEDVTVALDLSEIPFAPYLASNEVTFDDINEDKDKEARFELIAEAEADSGTYKIPVKMTYYVDGDEKESNGLISLIVKAEALIDLSVEDSVLIKGENADLTIRVINSGLGDARLLSLEVKPAVGIRMVSSNKAYIGDIDSDDFDTSDFKVSVGKNAPGIINLPVEIRYRDSRNKEVVELKNVEVRTYTEKQAVQLGLIKKSNTLTIVIGVIVVIVLFLIYRKWRKARRMRGAKEV